MAVLARTVAAGRNRRGSADVGSGGFGPYHPQRFGQSLEQAAVRIGFFLPPSKPSSQTAALDAASARQQLDRFSRSLVEAEARFPVES